MDEGSEPLTHCDACGLPLSEAGPARPGDLVDGRYLLLTALGDGAMGQVFEAKDVHLDRHVALKMVHPLLGSSLDFEREARALASVRHHNIPVIHSFGVHGHASFFVMELIDGGSLATVVQQHRHMGLRLPAFLAVQIVHQLALALAAAHARGIVHRDVKPENVIIENGTGRPVLVDFGVAVSIEPSDTVVRGSPAFMAPEVLSGGAASPASDLYSLACLAYELVCGVLPFDDRSLDALVESHLRRAAPPPSIHGAQLRPFDDVLLRALEKDPKRRYPTCTAFAAALERVDPKDEPAGPQSDISQLIPLQRGAIRILVVDDDPVFGRLAKRAAMVAFADAEVEVSRAKTGAAAVRNSERVLPQLLLLDYRLPGMDGVEVLSRIRALPGGEMVSVVVMSGEVGEEERWRFASLGVKDLLPKPVDFATLVDTIVRKGRERGWLSRDGAT